MANYEILKHAQELLDSGDCESALKSLQPLLEIGDAEALFLYSTFSVASLESEIEFERRGVQCLQLASQAGFLSALYALGVCYDLGDLIEPDSEKAAILFRKSAEAGYPKAKLNHGLNLYYGSNGIVEDKIQALSLIRQAANEGVESASEFLEQVAKE